jgi:hypothetical protein
MYCTKLLLVILLDKAVTLRVVTTVVLVNILLKYTSYIQTCFTTASRSLVVPRHWLKPDCPYLFAASVRNGIEWIQLRRLTGDQLLVARPPD